MNHIDSRLMKTKTLLLLVGLLLSVLPCHAVLKEKDLEHTLSILREEITTHYKDLQDEAKSHKQYREQIISELVEISRRSNQNAMML